MVLNLDLAGGCTLIQKNCLTHSNKRIAPVEAMRVHIFNGSRAQEFLLLKPYPLVTFLNPDMLNKVAYKRKGSSYH
jgi:hypothetical protein